MNALSRRPLLLIPIPTPWPATGLLPHSGEVWLRFLDGRPVSAVTIACLEWCCQAAAQRGTRPLLVVYPLPSKSPWLNPTAPTWVHTRRRVIEPTRLLGARLCHPRRHVSCPYPRSREGRLMLH